jgi:fumarate reductase iron-sulfur subunit
MCGSCAMTVNGRARWTCRTHVAEVAPQSRFEIAPLAHLPIVRDLVTDMRAFFDKWARAKGQFKPTATRHNDLARVEPGSRARRAADEAIECIGCGVCYAACDVVGWNPDYLGPAALNRAWTLTNDVRDGGRGVRLAAVAGDAGCHACHTMGSCTERCPKRLSPTASIAGLKRASAIAALRGEL